MQDAGERLATVDTYSATFMTSAARIETLRVSGADRFDPVGFRFIEVMARRAALQPASVKLLLERRLVKLLDDYHTRFEFARANSERLSVSAGSFPDADARKNTRPLAELLSYIGQCSPEVQGRVPSPGERPVTEARGELKTLSYFRSTWSQLSVEQQLAQALAELPENAGPLNSHRLVLQAMKQMRDISPDYLQRFMSYIETLFWLDQVENTRNSGPNSGKHQRSARKKSQ